jgi:4-hydroxybenzoate polyprenyltransferase
MTLGQGCGEELVTLANRRVHSFSFNLRCFVSYFCLIGSRLAVRTIHNIIDIDIDAQNAVSGANY